MELGVVLRVARDDVARRGPNRAIGGLFESTEAFARVVREVPLAELAVVDDVDANLGLTSDNLLHAARQSLKEGRPLVRATVEKLLKISGPRYRARVRDEDAVVAPTHTPVSYEV